MALNFPLNPTPGQVYTDPTTGLTYVWNNVIGAFESATQPPVILSETEPTTTIAGRLWYVPSTNSFKIYDGTSWINPTVDSGGAIISSTAPTQRPNGSSLSSGDIWWDSDYGVLYVYYDDGDSQQWVIASPTPGINSIPSGSSNAPSINFVGDTDTGIYSSGLGNVSISLNGTQKVSFDNSGINAVNTTGAWKIPVGNDSQRPSPSSSGMIRFNTSSNSYEGYDGTSWKTLTTNRITTSALPPAGANDGDMWFDEDTGGLYLYYTDTDTSQWVQVGGTDLTDDILSISAGGTGANNAADARTNLGTVAKTGDTFTGNVGINKTPTVPLDVLGNSSFTGNVDITGNSTLIGNTNFNGRATANIVSVPALNIDCSSGNFFTKTINTNSIFTISNVPTGTSYSFVLEIVHTSGTITWFNGVNWPNATSPTLTTGRTHLFFFLTDDGGTTWRASSLINYAS